jgi:hypothetical protein
MIRLLLLGVVGYLAFRIGREFVNSVPAGFEPTPYEPRRKGSKKSRRGNDASE